MPHAPSVALILSHAKRQLVPPTLTTQHICDGHARATFARSVRRAAQSPHHMESNCRHCELRTLLFRKIENAIAKLLKYATVMCKAFHRASSNHPSLITKLAAYRA